MENYVSPYKTAMSGIRVKIAMQAIRKIIREDDTDENKLAGIIAVVHEYEEDRDRAIEAEMKAEDERMEAEWNERKAKEAAEDFMDAFPGADKLTIRKGGK